MPAQNIAQKVAYFDGSTNGVIVRQFTEAMVNAVEAVCQDNDLNQNDIALILAQADKSTVDVGLILAQADKSTTDVGLIRTEANKLIADIAALAAEMDKEQDDSLALDAAFDTLIAKMNLDGGGGGIADTNYAGAAAMTAAGANVAALTVNDTPPALAAPTGAANATATGLGVTEASLDGFIILK